MQLTAEKTTMSQSTKPMGTCRFRQNPWRIKRSEEAQKCQKHCWKFLSIQSNHYLYFYVQRLLILFRFFYLIFFCHSFPIKMDCFALIYTRNESHNMEGVLFMCRLNYEHSDFISLSSMMLKKIRTKLNWN